MADLDGFEVRDGEARGITPHERQSAMDVNVEQLARRGAEIRLAEIAQEQEALRGIIRQIDGRGVEETLTPPVQARRRSLTPGERRAIGRRMKAYWAKWRAERAGR